MLGIFGGYVNNLVVISLVDIIISWTGKFNAEALDDDAPLGKQVHNFLKLFFEQRVYDFPRLS